MESVKIVSIGDGFTGKTCLLIKLTQNTFPRDYVPTVFDNYAAQMSIPIKGKQRLFNLNLWDTAGQEEYDTLRPLSYPGTDIFLLFFSIDEPDSFENITAKWVEEVEAHKASCPGAKLFVVGTKTDLRTDEGTIANLKAKGQHPITYKEGVELAKKIGAQKYVECSAKTENLKEVFIEIIQEYSESKSKVKTSAAMCCWKAGEPGQSEVVHISDG